MANAIESIRNLLTGRGVNVPVLTRFPQLQGSNTPRYTVQPPTLNRAGQATRARGTGRTGQRDVRALGWVPPGYVGATDGYPAAGYDYNPPTVLNHDWRPPRSVGLGDDFRQITYVSTPPPHDKHDADYTFTQRRSVYPWENTMNPFGWRELLDHQDVARYNLYNSIAQARPVFSNDVFMGYAVQPSTASGYGGGMGYVLGN